MDSALGGRPPGRGGAHPKFASPRRAQAAWMRQRSFRGDVRSRWKGAQCAPDTTIGTVAWRPAMGTRRVAWDTASDPGGPRPRPALRSQEPGYRRTGVLIYPLQPADISTRSRCRAARAVGERGAGVNLHSPSEPDTRDPRASFRSDRACLGVRRTFVPRFGVAFGLVSPGRGRRLDYRSRDTDTFPQTAGPTLRGSDWLSAQRFYNQIAGYLPTNTRLFRT